MKVRLMDVNGDPVEVYCEGTTELKAAIEVLQEKGVLPDPDEDGDDETDEPEPPTPAMAAAPAAELAEDELQDGQERQGA